MPNSVYQKVELVGTSPSSISEAITSAIEAAAKTTSNMAWFEVQEVRGNIQNGKVSEYQVVLKVGARLDRP